MWIEKKKNGSFKYVERYTDYLTGKTKKVSITLDKDTAQAKKMAESILREKIEKSMCTIRENGNLTLEMLVEAYRIDQKQTIKASTYSRNYFVCETLMKILGSDTLINRINAQYVRKAFLETHKAPGTLNELLTRFKALIRWGYKNEMIDDIHFLDKLEPFKDISKREKVADKYLEDDELKKLIDHMTHPVWKLVTKFLALSGLRFGEAAALEESDVDFNKKIITVSKTYDAINDIVTSPKTTMSNREIYMQPELLAVCKNIKLLMLEQRVSNGYPATNLFLQSFNGEHIKYYAYNKYLRENAKTCLNRHITPHTLRHTHASLLLEQGISVDTISRRLGHENSKITKEIYLHVTEKLKAKDNDQIQNIKIL